MIGNFKEVAEAVRNRFADSPLGKQLGEMDTRAAAGRSDAPHGSPHRRLREFRLYRGDARRPL